MKHRLGFAGKKLIRIALLLLGVSFVTFLLMSASPLDPLQTNVGQVALGSMSQEQVEALSAYWGVDTPPLTRYLMDGGLPEGRHQHIPALYCSRCWRWWESGFPVQLILLLSAWLLSGILGLFLGVVAGALRGKFRTKADPGILSGDFQYAGVLAGDPASFDLFCLAWLVPHRDVCAGGNGIVVGHFCRPGLSPLFRP